MPTAASAPVLNLPKGLLGNFALPTAATTATLTSANYNWVDQWSECSNLLLKMPYDVIDGAWVTWVGYFGFGVEPVHINGTLATGKDKLNSFVTMAAMLIGAAPETGMAKTVAKEAAEEVAERAAKEVAEQATTQSTRQWEVGAYKDLQGVEAGLDAHHAGQQAVMKDLIPNYDASTAPSILVPKVGHTIRGPYGIVSRSTAGFTNARQVIARDIFELRRVYPDIPNSSLQELIQMNKLMYRLTK